MVWFVFIFKLKFVKMGIFEWIGYLYYSVMSKLFLNVFIIVDRDFIKLECN